MASLALIVGLIFLCLIIIGPVSYIVSIFNWIPSIIKYLLGILSIVIGLWAIFIPVPLFRVLGLVNFSIGIKIILDTNKKTTQA